MFLIRQCLAFSKITNDKFQKLHIAGSIIFFENRPIAVVAGGFNNGFIYTVEIWDFTKRKEGATWIQGMIFFFV